MAASGQTGAEFLARHQSGDWGTVGPADAAENQLSVEQGFRILSAYTLNSGTRIWIITEADRSSTCILLPSEYQAEAQACFTRYDIRVANALGAFNEAWYWEGAFPRTN